MIKREPHLEYRSICCAVYSFYYTAFLQSPSGGEQWFLLYCYHRSPLLLDNRPLLILEVINSIQKCSVTKLGLTILETVLLFLFLPSIFYKTLYQLPLKDFPLFLL